MLAVYLSFVDPFFGVAKVKDTEFSESFLHFFSAMLQVGDVVQASFGRGVRTFKVDVVVYAIVRNKATVLTRDGTLFGPARLGSLQMVYGLEQIERVWWQRVLDEYRQLHDQGPNNVVADVAQDDIAEPNDDGNALVANANDVVPHIAAEEAPHPPVTEAITVFDTKDDAFACDICGEADAKFACSGACHFCADCLLAYSETLSEGRAQTQVPPCAQGCGCVMDWKTMASAIDSDAKFARLVTHFAAPQPVETSTVHDMLKEEDTVDSHLDKFRAKALAYLAEAQTLMKPCCKTAFFDFQDFNSHATTCPDIITHDCPTLQPVPRLSRQRYRTTVLRRIDQKDRCSASEIHIRLLETGRRLACRAGHGRTCL